MPLSRISLARSVLVVAPELLGCVIETDDVAIRVTEVEAYDGAGLDPASHAHRGPTPRTAVMFGEPGLAYSYFTYGMHWCLNVVTGPPGQASAVLLRAGEVVRGVDVARARRPSARRDVDLARGPARLCAALGVDGTASDVDLLTAASPIRLVDTSEPVSPARVRTGPRVGVSKAADRPWRFWIDGEPTVSPYRASARRVRLNDAVTDIESAEPPAPSAPGQPATPAAEFLAELQWRGLVAVSTDLGALRAALDAGPITLYCGFDPTAPSLHAGNLVQILTLRRFQNAGHRPLALVGGATGLIGDPKPTAERTLNEPDVVAGWVQRIRQQVEPFLSFTGDNAAVMVNNLDWTAELSAIDLLREIGRHFRVNKMITKEVVSARLNSEAGISYTEFSYQILQGMDFLELYRRYGCLMQTGGSDQWGNLTAGLDLIHKVEGISPHALATPLITKADGTKFGKTESGTVWLDPDLTSPYAFYQFWINADDRDVPTYLRIFSFRPRAELEALEQELVSRPAARTAQRELALELTTLVHGADQAQAAVAASRALFGQGELADLTPATLDAALLETAWAKGAGSATYIDHLVATGLAPTRSAARRTVSEGGAYVNNVKIVDPDGVPAPGDWLQGRWLVLRRGRRAMAGVQLTD